MPATMISLDLRGLSCPIPIIRTAKAMREARAGAMFEVVATDPGSVADFQAWARATGNALVEQTESDGEYRHLLRKREG